MTCTSVSSSKLLAFCYCNHGCSRCVNSTSRVSRRYKQNPPEKIQQDMLQAHGDVMLSNLSRIHKKTGPPRKKTKMTMLFFLSHFFVPLNHCLIWVTRVDVCLCHTSNHTATPSVYAQYGAVGLWSCCPQMPLPLLSSSWRTPIFCDWAQSCVQTIFCVKTSKFNVSTVA